MGCHFCVDIINTWVLSCSIAIYLFSGDMGCVPVLTMYSVVSKTKWKDEDEDGNTLELQKTNFSP